MYFKIYALLITPQANFSRLSNNTLQIKVSVQTKIKGMTCIMYVFAN